MTGPIRNGIVDLGWTFNQECYVVTFIGGKYDGKVRENYVGHRNGEKWLIQTMFSKGKVCRLNDDWVVLQMLLEWDIPEGCLTRDNWRAPTGLHSAGSISGWKSTWDSNHHTTSRFQDKHSRSEKSTFSFRWNLTGKLQMPIWAMAASSSTIVAIKTMLAKRSTITENAVSTIINIL